MANGRKTYRPCSGCGKPCTIPMIDKLTEWLCWGCTR